MHTHLKLIFSSSLNLLNNRVTQNSQVSLPVTDTEQPNTSRWQPRNVEEYRVGGLDFNFGSNGIFFSEIP